jgi:Transglycosylase SLT domain
MRISLPLAGVFGMLLCLSPIGLAIAAPRLQPALEPLDHAICRLIESSARANHLPVAFLTRTIWRESSFRAGAVSPAGAQGIAQFMPGTAQKRGLANPFDPEQAIPKAAALLADLRRQFGNLGIAAAAYNAGPARVASWLRGEGGLPAQTRAYVRLVTERSAEEWSAPEIATGAGTLPSAVGPEPTEAQSCVALTAELRRERGADSDDGPGFAALAPWGVQLAGNFSKRLALATFERVRHRYANVIGELSPMIVGRLLRSRGTRRFYQIRLPAASRQAATMLCNRIRSVGGNCIALRS